jgi:transposase
VTKSDREIMEIFEAYDLTRTAWSAAELTGHDPKTVKRYVQARDNGLNPFERAPRPKAIDGYLEKIEEWVDQSKAKIRADVVHDRLAKMGYPGSPRSTRRAVNAAKTAWRMGKRRTYRPWIPEPGMWLQFDWGEGPRIAGRRTWLFCAWLSWSRFRVVIPVWDCTLGTLVACLDTTLRRIGGAPTYVLTDNAKTVTVEHIAGIPVRHPQMVAAGRHYGCQVMTCMPYDPESKGGAEATVRIAKADLVPTGANLLEEYRKFGELETACRAFCEQVNDRPHRETRRRPIEALAEERTRLHPLPAEAFTVAFGTTRRVNWDCTISVEGVRYSVPHHLVDTRVWARFHGDELIVTAVGEQGPAEVARHPRSTPGTPVIRDEHYPPRENTDGERTPKATSAEEASFLALGPGAASWLIEAAAVGARRIRPKMAEAVALAKLHTPAEVDQALGTAAIAGRFAENDLIRILTHQAGREQAEPRRAGETHSLQPGTSAWSNFGRTSTPDGGEA